MDLTMMERVGDRWEKMEGSCSTGQSPQWAVVPVEEGEEESVLEKVAVSLQQIIPYYCSVPMEFCPTVSVDREC
jgi:hypothetical protein